MVNHLENDSIKYLGTFETEEGNLEAKHNVSQERMYSEEEIINALHSVELR